MKRLARAGWVSSLLFVWLLATETAHGADKWLSVRSQNFLLVGNASESVIRRIGRNLEEFRAGFSLIFPAVGKQSPTPITVVVFKNDDSFKPFKPLYEGKPANMGGFFQPGHDVNFIALTGDNETPHVIFHEFVHALTKDGAVTLPPWASEGLAEFYGMFEISSNGKEMLVGRPMVDHIGTLQQTRLPVSTLFNVDHSSPFYNENTKQGIFYAESWAVMHFLMLSNNGQYRPKLSQFLALHGAGKSVEESFREAFQTDFVSFDKELTNYVSRYSFPVIRYTLQDKIDFNREMQVTALTEAQAQYYLGDLLYHIGRLDAAEAQLQSAISLDPGFAPSYASLGMLRVQQQRHQEALKALTQAVEADSKNYMAHYYYASMLQRVGDDAIPGESRLPLMKQHLKRTIELAPDYLNAYDMLGYVALVLREELPETEELMKKALALSPNRRSLRLRLAELMVANNEAVAARSVVTPLLNAEEDSIRQQARLLLDGIQQYVDNLKAIEEYQQRRLQADAAAAIEKLSENVGDDPSRPTITRRATEGPDENREPVTVTPQIVTRPVGQQLEGALLSLDCTRGVTFRVRTGNGVVELHSDDPSKIEFISYTTAVSDTFTCGALPSPRPVMIIYRRSSDPRYLGEPLRIEFPDKK